MADETYCPTLEGDERERQPMLKRNIIKSIFGSCITILLLDAAFDGLENLQSTLNKKDGLGTTGLATVYGFQIIGCLFLPPFVMAYIGSKWTIALSTIGIILYMGANMHAVAYLIYPASGLLGLCLALRMAAMCTYINEIAVYYSKVTKQEIGVVINFFAGILCLVGYVASILGYIVSSTVLKMPRNNISDDDLERCGPNFCPYDQGNNTNLDRPDDIKVYVLVGTYVACTILSLVSSVVLLDNLKRKRADGVSSSPETKKISRCLLVDTFRLCLTSKRQALLIPLTMYRGIEQTFIVGEFTKAYISCSVGVWHVGYIMICYSAFTAVFSFLFGRFIHIIRRVFLLNFGAIVSLSAQIWMIVWTPLDSAYYVLFVFAALWGVGNAVWETQTFTLYSQLFSDAKEAAFANLFLWDSLGATIAFGYSDALCTQFQIYICMSVLLLGMAGYAIVEAMEKRKSRRNKENIEIEAKPWIDSEL